MQDAPGVTESTRKGAGGNGHRFKAAVTATAVFWSVAVALVFFWVPEIQGLGPDAKIFFFHVPSAWLMLLSAVVAGVAAGASLATGRRSLAAGPAMELAALFGLVVMVTGPLWAWRAWGRPWVWEPRLTTSLVCWLTFLAAAGLNASKSRARKETALVVALMGALEVPLVYLSVRWWQGAHHPPQTLVLDLHGRLAFGLLAATVAATALWALLFFEARRLADTEDRIARTEALVRPGRAGGLAAAILALALFGRAAALAGPPPQDSDPPAQASVVRDTGHGARTESKSGPRREAKTGQGKQADGFRPYEARAETAPQRGYAAVLAAYLALWVIVFLYLLRLDRTRRALESRLSALERAWGRRAGPTPDAGRKTRDGPPGRNSPARGGGGGS